MIQFKNTNAKILKPVDELNYFEIHSVHLDHKITPVEAWNLMSEDPRPILKLAFWIRDAISGLFGVKQIRGFKGKRAENVAIGDKLDFFRVEDVSNERLVLTERDRHLDVMICISVDGFILTITSSVDVHNLYGRIYMLPVGIAHRWIVRSDLKRLRTKVKNLSAEQIASDRGTGL